MSRKKRKHGLERAFVAILGFACAVILGVVFYGTMVYQLAGEADATDPAAHTGGAATPAPLAQGLDAKALFPGALLALGDGTLVQEQAQDVRVGGALCRVITRVYERADGTQATAISATPAAYLERLSEEGWQPQLITGFVVGGLDAVYALRNGKCLLAARNGAYVYMIETEEDEQAAYALGALAELGE